MIRAFSLILAAKGGVAIVNLASIVSHLSLLAAIHRREPIVECTSVASREKSLGQIS